MIAPTPTALAAMAAVVCPEDGGEHPLAWSENPRPSVAALRRPWGWLRPSRRQPAPKRS